LRTTRGGPFDAEIERLSKRGATPLRRTIHRLARPWAPAPMPVERATSKRQLELLPDPHGELPRGRFTIVFQLPAPEQTDMTGTATVSVTSGIANDGLPTARVEQTAPAYARLDTKDDLGERTFEIRQEKVIIGRGGPGVWVTSSSADRQMCHKSTRGCGAIRRRAPF
jgi:hypothetical protein